MDAGRASAPAGLELSREVLRPVAARPIDIHHPRDTRGPALLARLLARHVDGPGRPHDALGIVAGVPLKVSLNLEVPRLHHMPEPRQLREPPTGRSSSNTQKP